MDIATRADLRNQLERGKEYGCTHMIVVVDTFDHSDYPVYVSPEQNAQELVDKYNNFSMQKVIAQEVVPKLLEKWLGEK